MPTDLEHFLDAHYPAGPFRLREPLTTSGHRLAWLAETPAGRWTVKLTDPGRPESQVRRDVGTPAYLAGLGFPAPEPLPALDGALYLPFGERFLYVLRYL